MKVSNVLIRASQDQNSTNEITYMENRWDACFRIDVLCLNSHVHTHQPSSGTYAQFVNELGASGRKGLRPRPSESLSY